MMVGRRQKLAGQKGKDIKKEDKKKIGGTTANAFVVLQAENTKFKECNQFNKVEKMTPSSDGTPACSLEKGKTIGGDKNFSHDSVLFLQGLEGLRDAPVWLEGQRVMAIGIGADEKKKNKGSRNKKGVKNPGTSTSPSSQSSANQVPDSRLNRIGAFIFRGVVPKEGEVSAQGMTTLSEGVLGLPTQERGSGQTPLPCLMDQ